MKTFRRGLRGAEKSPALVPAELERPFFCVVARSVGSIHFSRIGVVRKRDKV